MKAFSLLALVLSLPAWANDFSRDPDFALKTEFNGQLIATSSVLAKAILAGKVCQLGTSRREIMANVMRIERSFAPWATPDERMKSAILNAPYMAGAMKDFLAWQLFAEGIELNRFEPRQNLPKVKELMERTSPFRMTIMSGADGRPPFGELKLLPNEMAELEIYDGVKIEKRPGRWEFSVVKERWAALEHVIVTVVYEGKRYPFALGADNAEGTALRAFKRRGDDYDWWPDGGVVMAQDQFGCAL
jgi:hypothetical protein